MTETKRPTPGERELAVIKARQILDGTLQGSRSLALCHLALAAEREALEERVRALLRSDEPWDLRSIVAKLTEAAGVLLHDRGYDAMGWEDFGHAREAAEKWLAADDAKAVGEPDEPYPDFFGVKREAHKPPTDDRASRRQRTKDIVHALGELCRMYDETEQSE